MSSLMDECQEGLPLECLNDLATIQMTDRPICHLNDCPYLPILTIKNGRITAVFGRMGFYYFFVEFFGFFGIFLFFHSLAASVKRYFC